jgi:hypothetical protein
MPEDGNTSMFMDWQINIVKMVRLPKAIYRFNAMPIDMSLFADIEESVLKFIWELQRPQTAKAILSKKSNTEAITILDSNYTTEP